MVLRTIIALLLLLTLQPLAPAEITAEEIASSAAWLGRLDVLPDLRDKPYIEICCQNAWAQGAMVEQNRERGFLLEEDDKSYTLFCDGVDRLHESRFSRGGAWRFGVKVVSKMPLEDTDKASVRQLDLAVVVDEAIAEIGKPDASSPKRDKAFGQVPSDRTALFLLANCCSQQGRADLAEKLDAVLLDLAAKPADNSHGGSASFRALAEKDIAHALMWRAVVEIGKPAISRPELLAQFERIARDFPASPHHDKAAEYAATLRTMIAEDEAHAATAKPLAQMSREEQIREWIFRLRDQHGSQMSEPGGVELLEFMVKPGAEPSPGMHLVQLGYAAVPAVIEALDDHRLTRSVWRAGSSYFSHEPLTVSECANDILSRISGCNFRVVYGNKPPRDEIMSWWQEMEAKGEKAMLVKNVSSATGHCDEQIPRLIELDPAAAVEAIQKGVGNCKVNWVQARMIDSIATIHSKAATKALRDELRQCPSTMGRVAAAQALFHRGEKNVVPAMIAEWNKWDGVFEPGRYETPDSLIAFLVRCGDIAAMKALAARFSAIPRYDRFKVLAWATGTQRRSRSSPADQPRIPAETAVVAEELCISALNDRTSEFSGAGEFEGARFDTPRVCDLVAYALAKAWPKRYAFTWTESPFARDAQIAKLRNLWRQAHGLKARPLPVRPSLAAAANDPNIVAGCRWLDGPEIKDLPISVGKPLTGDGLFDTIAELARALPPGSSAFELTVDRSVKRDGIVVEITWIHRRAPDRRKEFKSECLFAVGEKMFYHTNSGFPLAPSADAFRQEKWAAARVLESPDDEPATMRFYCW